MRILIHISAAAALTVFAAIYNVDAQVTTTTVTSTSSAGTVTEFGPNTIAVRGDTGTPIRYTSTRTTTYVDENGNPVAVETVRSGSPVTVYYTQTPAGMVADKVVVRRTTTTATVPVPGPGAGSPPAIDGIISSADEDSIALRSDTAPGKLHYKARSSTAYVDQNGNPVSRKMLKAGTPVTVFYEKDDDSMLATRVVVKTAPVIEKQTTTTTETTTTR